MFAKRNVLGLGVTLAFFAASAQAHIPIFSTADSGSTPENAIFIDDPSISHAVYHELTAATPQMWVTFDYQAGDEIYVQFGMPVLDRLIDYRPAVAVLGPGLPEIDLPFDIPAGLGGLLFETDDIDDPEFFFERYTSTDSWIFGELEDTAPESGTYYMVAYSPAGEDGKFWAAVGRREVFEPVDIISLPVLVPQVKAFHEVSNATALPCFFFPAAAAFGAFCFLKVRRNGRLGS